MRAIGLSLTTLLLSSPVLGAVPSFSLNQATVNFAGEALERLTTVVPSDPPCDDPVQLTVAARGDIGSRPFSLQLTIKPGPSYSVDEVVENRLNQVFGTLIVGEGKQAIEWSVNKFAVGVFHARGQFASGGLTFLLPARFHNSQDLSPRTGVYGLLALKCGVTGRDMQCTDLRFVFGDQMGQMVGSAHTIEEIVGVSVPESLQSQDALLAGDCCFGESRCKCTFCTRPPPLGQPCPPLTCPSCGTPGACPDCQFIGCPACP